MSLTIDEILASDDSAPKEVNVPEWGGNVLVRGLSASTAIHLGRVISEITGTDQSSDDERLALSLAAYLCKQDGSDFATLEQARALTKKSAAAVNRIVTAGSALNAMDAKAAETAAKN